MFDLENRAATIVAILGADPDLETVAYIDQDDQSMRYPVTFPAAFVALEKLVVGAGKSGRVSVVSDITWTVVVRSKQLDGPGGCLPVVDKVIDILEGFKPGDDSKKLSLLEVAYFDKHAESVAYAVRFGTMTAGVSRNTPCGR
jgi:hypothetical protein